ncbi:MAG: NAD-glutamate dehydrogenase domain-containing protein, partial [Alphaproteobacteria bacterium]
IGAFNHLHIFIDPDPDPKASFAERKRLFELPRSSWSDYDAKLISKGGGIFERSAKTINLSPQIRAMLGIEEEKLAPNDLLRALLKMPADLLWFGGIGTYVKSVAESDGDAGDRANDPLRVNARELQCKVIGEGANLGITQLGRVEFSRAGGLINTDFIDNSAGVDTSDHEVNIKIVLDDVVTNGDMTEKQRNELLATMTDDIAALVLNDNYLQTQAISLASLHAPALLDQQWRMIRALERSGRLNREIEFLPDDEEMGRRQTNREGLSRPENAVLFSYAKLDLYEELLPTDVPDDAYLVGDQARYFPKKLQARYPEQIANHRLRREIIATYVVNSLVNRVGATFVHNMQARTGLPAADIARAFVAARDAFGLRPVWREIEKLDNKVGADVQAQMVTQLMHLAERVTKWFLDNEPQPLNIAETIARYGAGVEALSGQLSKIVGDDDKAAMTTQVAGLVEQGVPKKLAERIAGLAAVGSACDIVRIADGAGVPVVDAGRIYFKIGSWLGADWLREASRQVKVESEWQRLAVDAIVDDSFGHQSQITAGVLQGADGGALANGTGERLIDQWLDGRRPAVERTGALIGEMRAALEVDLAMLTVANRQLRTLVAA